jgi:nitrate/nitrite-specific signal transduction histidine kinase
MVEAFEYNPVLLKDAYRLWSSRGYLPSKGEFNALRVMSQEDRHTFINDLLAFESVVNVMKMTPLIDDRIRLLVAKRQYDAARKLAKQYPGDAIAQQYLRDIDTLETPLERGAKSGMKYLAYAALIVLVIAVAIVVFTIIYLNR